MTGSLTVQLVDGTAVVVPPSLSCITTYVLLEQEAWFEKEWAFLTRYLKPGMRVIDIGANVGVYALAAARAVGPSGHVHAYEPGSEARALLEAGRAANGLKNLTICRNAVSNSPGSATLSFGVTSEIHRLNAGGAGETVDLTTLDAEEIRQGWGTIDVLKIDAEGEERRIVEGGRDFFARQSPLVLFEHKVGDFEVNDVDADFRKLGYGIYRLVPGGPFLVPSPPDAKHDSFELNLFAAKPDRAAALARETWLVEAVPSWRPDEARKELALGLLSTQPFGRSMTALLARPIDATYRDALSAYAAWRTPQFPLPQRYAALHFAYRTLQTLCRSMPTLGRLCTYARVAWEMGERDVCIEAGRSAFALMNGNANAVNEICWPPVARFDAIEPGQHVWNWLMLAIIEMAERATAHSSYFQDKGIDLDWACRQPHSSVEMERRKYLRALKTGVAPQVPFRLKETAAAHLNATLWRERPAPLS